MLSKAILTCLNVTASWLSRAKQVVKLLSKIGPDGSSPDPLVMKRLQSNAVTHKGSSSPCRTCKTRPSGRVYMFVASLTLPIPSNTKNTPIWVCFLCFLLPIFDAVRRYPPPHCVVIPVFTTTRRYPPPRSSHVRRSEEVPTSSLCRYSCFRHKCAVLPSFSFLNYIKLN